MSLALVDFPKTQEIFILLFQMLNKIPNDIQDIIIVYAFDCQAMAKLRKIMYVFDLRFYSEDSCEIEIGDNLYSLNFWLKSKINSSTPAVIKFYFQNLYDSDLQSMKFNLTLERFWLILTDNADDFVALSRDIRAQIRKLIMLQFTFIRAAAECAQICAARFGQLAE